MKEQVLKILSSKKLVINEFIIRIAKEKELNLNEFLVLVYFDNSFDNKFDVELIVKTLGIDTAEVMESFNTLMIKGLVSLESVKDLENRNTEEVNLDGLYKLITEEAIVEEKDKEKEDIFKVFESELGRTISSMELEMINGWLTTGTSEEIILGALREAVYNGVTSFRYIDKIIYEWEKKGFKTMDDVNKYMKSRREEKSKDKEASKKASDVLDYDWIDS
ncbi:MAG: DnaD domain protein [Bacilli bacterium]|nr:DnaD domain protein [Bacilli bacterium]